MYCDLIDDDELIQNGRPSTRVGQAYLIFSIFSTTQTTRTRGFGERRERKVGFIELSVRAWGEGAARLMFGEGSELPI